MTKNRNDGKLIPFEEIVKNREELVPKISEGYQQFEIILNNCIDNGIQTIACCAGHEISDYPYITFVYNRNSRKMINGFLNAIKDTKGTHIMFSTTGCTDNPFNVTVYANMINRDKVFNTIMHSLYEGKKSDTLYDDLNAVLRLAINLDYERNYFATVTLYNKMFMKSFISIIIFFRNFVPNLELYKSNRYNDKRLHICRTRPYVVGVRYLDINS